MFAHAGWEWDFNFFTDFCGCAICAGQRKGAGPVRISTGCRGKALGADEVY